MLLYNIADQISVMAQGTIFTKPGMLRISKWYPGFNPNNHIQTTTPVRVRVFYLPLEYMKEQALFNISRGVGMPLKLILKPSLSSLYQGNFGTVLVEVGCAHPLSNNIQKQGEKSGGRFLYQSDL